MSEGDSTSTVQNELRWLWFDLHGPYLGERHPRVVTADELATELVQLEPLLAKTARCNRRALILFVVGVAAALLLNRLWLAFVYRIVFPLNDAHVLDGETQYWLSMGTMWIQYAALIPAFLAFLALPQMIRLNRALGRAHAGMRSLGLDARRDAVQQLRALRTPRVIQMLEISARWRRLLT